ncbi:AAA family ATPase [Rhizobium sp. X9]|uniref:AAA family ATPase n=1 Tax=Rhizobium sp. X9 TaxID=2815360 RepID=UPI001C0A94E1|nr:AAA family ATPase [Rhizobium sp. X9]
MKNPNWTRYFNPPVNLVTTVAGMSVRRSIRHFLHVTHYIIAIRLPDLNDARVYETAARTLLDPECLTDEEGHTLVLVTNATNLKEGAWDLVRKFDKLQRALIFYTDNSSITKDIALLVDFRIDMRLPEARHFKAAAKTLGLVIDDDDADFLATVPLSDIRLALRPNRSVRSLVQRLKFVAPQEPQPVEDQPQPLHPRLEDLAGFGAAKVWGLQLAADIKAWMAGEIEWADVDKGIVLAGPSGTGKSTFPRALSNTCGISFVSSSAAAWQAMGHLGDMLKAMRATFKEAAAVRPAVLFIDEIDSVGDREANRDSSHHDYKRQVINGLLECMDSTEGREGVIVVGATNDASAIDAALLRPGRFEQVVPVELPDEDDRKAILKYHLPEVAIQDFGPFVAQTEAWSGADIEKLARDARRKARRAGRKAVTDDDLRSVMPVLSPYTDEERYRLAVHEVGHAVVGATLRSKLLLHVKINRWKPSKVGWNQIGVTYFSDNPALMTTASYFTDTIAILLSGMAAERIFFGEHSIASGGDTTSDLTKATDLATMMERSFAFGDGLLTDMGGGTRPMENLRQFDPHLRQAIRQRLDAQYDRVVQILTSKRAAVQSLSERLSECLELDAAVIHEALRDQKEIEMGVER